MGPEPTASESDDVIVRTVVFNRREMAERGRRGGLVTGQRPERVAILARARAAFLAKLADQADPDHRLPDEERLRLARELRSEHLRAKLIARKRPRGTKRAGTTSKVGS